MKKAHAAEGIGIKPSTDDALVGAYESVTYIVRMGTVLLVEQVA